MNLNQSVITKDRFRSDWIEIKRIQVKFLFDSNFHAMSFDVGGFVVLKTPVKKQQRQFDLRIRLQTERTRILSPDTIYQTNSTCYLLGYAFCPR